MISRSLFRSSPFFLCSASAAAATSAPTSANAPKTASPPPPPLGASQERPEPLAEALLSGKKTVLEMNTPLAHKEDQKYIINEMRRESFRNWTRVLSSLGCIVLTMMYMPIYVNKFNMLVADRRDGERPMFGPVHALKQDWDQIMAACDGDEKRASATFWKLYREHQQKNGSGDGEDSNNGAQQKSMFVSRDTALNTGKFVTPKAAS